MLECVFEDGKAFSKVRLGRRISEMGVEFDRHPYLQSLPHEDFGHWSRELVVYKLMLGEEVSFHYSKGEQGNQHHLCFS